MGSVQRSGRRWPEVVAWAEWRRQHSRRGRGVCLYGRDSVGAAGVHRSVADYYRRPAALRGNPTVERYRQRLVADLERFALDCFRRGADRLAEHRSAGGYLDDRVVCGLFRMHVHRPGVRAEEVQTNLTITPTEAGEFIRMVNSQPAEISY